MCWSLFLMKLQAFRAANLLKRDLYNPVNPYHFKGHVKIVEIYMVKT